MPGGLRPGAVLGVLREFRAGDESGPLVVSGAPALADGLRRELGRDAAPGAVASQSLVGAAALVHVLAAAPSGDDEAILRQAERARIPAVVVVADPGIETRVPFVRATDVIRVPTGSGFPVDEVATAIARRLGDDGASLAARVPAVREAVCEVLIERASRRNALLAVAVFVPGADLPVLTVNQLRLVLRIGAAHGVEIGQERLPEVLAVVGSAFGFRALARRLVAGVPVAGWALKGGVAYGATRALGEAAVRYFASIATPPGAGSGAAR